jgi:uncharacterized Zn finger protein
MAESAVLSEALIKRRASAGSFSRGVQYFQSGAVQRLSRRGAQIRASVEGSSYQPYEVAVTLDAIGVSDASCTCPYDWGGDCKHIVATLLACIETPEEVEEAPTIEAVLEPLERDHLKDLVLWLVEREPGLADLIEARALSLIAPAPASGVKQTAPVRRTTIDSHAYRRQVTAAIRSLDRTRRSEAHRHVGGVAGEIRQVAEQARPFIEAGDGRSALAILNAVTDEYVQSWYELDDSDGEASACFEDLDALWAEALLTADLSAEEREIWAGRLAAWAEEADQYGVVDAFEAAEMAAVQGWDDPNLRRMLAGDVAGVAEDAPDADGERPEEDLDEDWDGAEDEAGIVEAGGRLGYEPFAWARSTLVRARLNVLERQGRFQEYLNLAAASGHTGAYLAMLVRLDRVDEAVAAALDRLSRPEEALAFAETLRGHGHAGAALRIAEHGLTLPGSRVLTARWLRDAARATGDADRALRSAAVAAKESAALDDYREAEALAGERWPEVRETLLSHMRGNPVGRTTTAVEVLLYEGLIDEAIALAETMPLAYGTVEQVVDAAIESHPDWVVRTCRTQAERIMEEGRSQQYHYAARWLERARRALLAAGRGDEWTAYIEQVLERHRRKYSLVPLLQPLR